MGSPLGRLFPYLRRYRRQFGVGLACAVATTAVSLTSPWVLKHAIDDLLAGVSGEKLRVYGALLLALGLGSGLFRFLMRRILVGVSRHVEYDLRNDFFAHLQRQPLGYFQAHRIGDLMSRATNDLNAVRMMIGPAVMYSTNTGIVFVVALALMVSIDWWLTLVALAPLPFVSVAVVSFGRAIHRRFERIQAQLADLSAVAQEALAGVRVVRAYRQEEAEIARFRRSNLEYLERNRRLIRLQGLFYPSLSLLLALGGLLVLWLGSQEVIRHRITVGEFVAFNSYLAMLAWPMIAFGWVTNLLQRGMASWGRMLEVLDAAPAITDPPSPRIRSSGQVRGAISIRHLTFRFPTATRPVLEDVSLEIAAGETAALVGRTGSGKSTLIGLLARLHDPPPGTVLIDDVDVRDFTLAALCGAIGFVPQEPFLFSDTIAENIAWGVRHGEPGDAGPETSGTEQRTRKQIEWAAAVARLDQDLPAFPRGYDTLVGERGITLSGGQKQRTALARALAVDPRILILDDALSSVDTDTEEEILARLRAAMRGRTSILVSHRISTVRHADRIFVLDRGRIVERGRHEELVALGGVYAEMYRRQLLEEELAAS